MEKIANEVNRKCQLSARHFYYLARRTFGVFRENLSPDSHHQPFCLVHNLNCGVNGRWTRHIHLKRSAVHRAGDVLSLGDTPQCKAAVEVSIILHTAFQQIPQKMDEPIRQFADNFIGNKFCLVNHCNRSSKGLE